MTGITPAIFQRLSLPDWTVLYASTLNADTRFYDGPAPAWCPLVSPIDLPNMVRCPTVFLVTAGRLLVENTDLEPTEFTAGQGVSAIRSKNRYRFTVLENGTSYVCLTPTEDKYCSREAVSLPTGGTYTAPGEVLGQKVFVATDGVDGISRFSLIEIAAGQQRVFTANAPAYLLRLWDEA